MEPETNNVQSSTNVADDSILLHQQVLEKKKLRMPKMPKLYTEEDFANAIAAIKCGLSYRKASQQFGVPKSTLTDRISGGKHKRQEQIFSRQEEMGFVEYFIKLSQRECGVNSLEIRNTIKCWLDRDNKKVLRFNDNMPTANWVTQFKKRHPSLNIRPLRYPPKVKVKREAPEPMEVSKVYPDSTQESFVEQNVMSTAAYRERTEDRSVPLTTVDRTIPHMELTPLVISQSIPSSVSPKNLQSPMERNVTSSSMERDIPYTVIPSSEVENSLQSPIERNVSTSSMERDNPHRLIPSSVLEKNLQSSMERNPETSSSMEGDNPHRLIPSSVAEKNHHFSMERHVPASAMEQDIFPSSSLPKDGNIPLTSREETIAPSVIDKTINRTVNSRPMLADKRSIPVTLNGQTVVPPVANRSISTTTLDIRKKFPLSLHTSQNINSENPDMSKNTSEVLASHSKSYVALKALENTLTEHEKNIFHRRFEESTSIELDTIYIAWKVLKHQCMNESPTMVNDHLRSEKFNSYTQKEGVCSHAVGEETMNQIQELIKKYKDVDVEKKPSVIVTNSEINNHV